MSARGRLGRDRAHRTAPFSALNGAVLHSEHGSRFVTETPEVSVQSSIVMVALVSLADTSYLKLIFIIINAKRLRWQAELHSLVTHGDCPCRGRSQAAQEPVPRHHDKPKKPRSRERLIRALLLTIEQDGFHYIAGFTAAQALERELRLTGLRSRTYERRETAQPSTAMTVPSMSMIIRDCGWTPSAVWMSTAVSSIDSERSSPRNVSVPPYTVGALIPAP